MLTVKMTLDDYKGVYDAGGTSFVQSLFGAARSVFIVCMYVCMYCCMYMYACLHVNYCLSFLGGVGGGRSTPFRVSIAFLHVNYCLSFSQLFQY